MKLFFIMPIVTLLAGPRLMSEIWPDDGPSQEEEVTERAVEFLFDRLILGEGVRFRDLLGLFDHCPMLESVYRRCYARELCADAARGPMPDDEPTDLLYLEIRRSLNYESSIREYEGFDHFYISAMGHYYDEDSTTSTGIGYYSLAFVPPRSILNLPVVFNADVFIRGVLEQPENHSEQLPNKSCHELTLGALLQTVLWQMSWFGPPE